jgi:rhodanese-related sulfurtransferase
MVERHGMKPGFSRRTAFFFGLAGASAMFASKLGASEAGAPKPGGAAVPIVTSAQLAKMLQQKDFFFVNVHTPYQGEIEKTDAFIVFDTIADHLDQLPKNKDAKIVLYCRSGHMSEIAARQLISLGYTQVSHLAGGMIDWKKQGFEIITK